MIFGIRAVIEAVEAGKEIDKILIKKDLQGDLAKELFDLIKGRGFFVQRVPGRTIEPDYPQKSSRSDRFYLGGVVSAVGRYNPFFVRGGEGSIHCSSRWNYRCT